VTKIIITFVIAGGIPQRSMALGSGDAIDEATELGAGRAIIPPASGER
jgi:hypothetical protein